MIQAVKTRLACMADSPFMAIEGAGRLADLNRNKPNRERLPLAAVYPLRAVAADNALATGLVSQTVTAHIGVAIFASAQAERQGERAVMEVESLYHAVRKQLVGWMPDDTEDETYLGPMLFAGGESIGMEDGIVLWIDEFTVPQLLRRPLG